MSARLRARLLSVFSAVALIGCALAPPQSPEAAHAAWEARQARLQQVHTWELQGRLAVRAGDQGGQMGLRWRRQPGRDVIDLTGPLSRPLLHLERDVNGAWLRDAEQKTYAAPDPESLVLSLTGWRLPLNGLPYWVLGLSLPDAAMRPALDGYGRLRHLEQLGWAIDFQEYAVYDGWELPRKLLLRRTEAGAPDTPETAVELRLVIAQWALK